MRMPCDSFVLHVFVKIYKKLVKVVTYLVEGYTFFNYTKNSYCAQRIFLKYDTTLVNYVTFISMSLTLVYVYKLDQSNENSRHHSSIKQFIVLNLL